MKFICKILTVLSFFIGIMSNLSCNDEDELTISLVKTLRVTDIGLNSAICFGEVSSDGGSIVTERGICWSLSDSLSITDEHKSEGKDTGMFSVAIADLEKGTTYYICAYAINDIGISYGEIVKFTTIDYATVTTSEVSEIDTTSAICGGKVTQNGGQKILDKGICWSIQRIPTIDNNIVIDNSESSEFSIKLKGLSGGVTYYVRAYVNTSLGTSYGDVVSFTTKADLPVVKSDSVYDISNNNATFFGHIVYDGGTDIIAQGVCWSTKENPTLDGCRFNIEDKNNRQFSSVMSGLMNGTTYYARSFAMNNKGTSFGEQFIFKTTNYAKVVTADILNITETSAECGGQVTDDGNLVVFERGVCWSTNENPTILDNHTNDGVGIGLFKSLMTGLSRGTTYYVRSYAINSLGTTYGEQQSFSTPDYNGKEEYVVDLGLPSGTKWADRNVGAYSPESSGSYYTWGALRTGNYFDCDYDPKGDGQNGYDNIGKDISGTIYDVAHMTWGGTWKMPTKDQFDELISNCKWKWITQNGMSGYRVESKINGNSIFLPAAGCRYSFTLESFSFSGYYWSSSLSNGIFDNHLAFKLAFTSAVYTLKGNGFREYGNNIRPVIE